LVFRAGETTPAPSALPPFLRGNFLHRQAPVIFSQLPAGEGICDKSWW